MSEKEKQRQDLLLRCVQDPLAMGRIVAPKMFRLSPCEMHFAVRDALISPGEAHVNIIGPREHAKTTVAARLGTLWHIFCQDLYERREMSKKVVLLISKSRGHSIDSLTSVKNILEYSDAFRAIFGYWGMHNASEWTRDRIVLKNGSAILCRGTGQQIRGINIDGMRPTLIVVDDLEDEENTRTEDRMESTLRWFFQAVVPAGTKDTKILSCATPQHQRCLVEMLAKMENWKTLRYKAINVDESGNEYALWPQQKSLAWLNKKKESMRSVGRYSIFAREYQCEIIGDEDQIFREEYFRWWDGSLEHDGDGMPYLRITHLDHKQLEAEKKVPINLFGGIDPAVSTKGYADYSVIFTIGLDRDKNIYCVHYVRRRMHPDALVKEILSQYEVYRWQKCELESNLFRGLLKPYIRMHDLFVPGMEIRNTLATQRKEERLEGLQPFFASRKVFLRENMTAFTDELLNFPRSSHDDCMDAFYYARKSAYAPFHEIVEADDKKAPVKYYDWMVE